MESSRQALTGRMAHGTLESSSSSLQGVSLKLVISSEACCGISETYVPSLALSTLSICVPSRLETRYGLSARPMTLPHEEPAR
jgi:hypothetical protein